MMDLGTVAEDSTVVMVFTTNAASGAEENYSVIPVQADCVIYKAGVAMTLDASTITITNLATGVYKASVDLSNDADFTTGAHYVLVVDDGTSTIDSVSVSGVVGYWYIESAAQQAARTFNEAMFITDTVSTTTSNSTTVVNLTDFLDAQAPDNSNAGELWLWQDSTGELEYFRVQSMTSLVATVEAWPAGGALSAAVAASDKLWRVGYVDVNAVAVSGDIAAADNWEEFATSIVTGTAGATSLATTTCSSDLTAYADDELIGRTIIFTSGTAAGQAARVYDYANTNGVISFTTITTAPLQNDTFVIV